jgi:hypothetical protein
VTKDERIARGQRVGRFLADPDVQDAISSVRQTLCADFLAARPDDLLEVHYKNKALTLLLAQLESWRDDALMETRR